MAPPTLPNTLTTPLLLPIEPLTPSSFAPFGTAISSPFSPSLATPPRTIPAPVHAPHQSPAVFANQNSALKTSPISIFEDRYLTTTGAPPSKPQMSMFSCFPRNLSGIGIERAEPDTQGRGRATPDIKFRVSILERHPYTTQTFSPLGLSPTDTSSFFLVIVAPSRSIPTTSAQPHTVTNPPDLTRLRAFLALGDQAVTYGAGTWHAPMVVLGPRRVDFVVTQFVNGVPDDDCQEVLLGANVVRVDVGDLGLEETRTAWAKL